MRSAVCLCVVLIVVACLADARRSGGGGSRRGGFGFGGSKHKTPAPPPRTDTSSSSHFLNFERGSSGSGSTHNRGNPFSAPAPKPPTNTNGPIGFERFGGTTNQGNQKLGFEKVSSDVQNKPSGSHTPSAPYPVGPPPAYPGTHAGSSYSGTNDHPPPYPGRPVNAPPAYNPHYGQPNPSQPHGQYNPYQGQGYQPNFGNAYPQQNQFGYGGHGSYQPYGGSPYPGNSGYSFGGNSYQGNSFGGSPFGGGYNGNPHYSSNNFGYSNNPGYFNNGYDNYHKKSRFGGLPIPIPIPIPIPLGGFGGFGSGFGGHSYSHRVLDKFISSKNTTAAPSNSSTSVFILNNSTVTPCTTDHFLYEMVKITVMACTSENCSAIKLFTTTNVSSSVSVHSAAMTMCLEGNASVSHSGDNVVPAVSDIRRDRLTVCRDVPDNATATNVTAATANTTKVCDTVECFSVEMCLPDIEIVDKCNTVDCPFRRSAYKACTSLKMCRSPNAGVSTFASLNTTAFKIDEYNHPSNVYHDVNNLTLISYHRPVVRLNCTQNASSPGCPPATPPPNAAASAAATPADLAQVGCPVAGTTSGELPANGTVCTPGAPANTSLTDPVPHPTDQPSPLSVQQS